MSDSIRKIASIGEPLIEISEFDGSAQKASIGVAGDTLNCAITLARELAGEPAEVGFVTMLGTDAFSDHIVETMAAEAIGTGLVGRHPTRLPGIYAIELDDNNDRSFRYWRSESAARTLFTDGPVGLADLEPFDVIYLSAISLAILPEIARHGLITKCRELKETGTVIVFDSNYRPQLWPDVDSARQTLDAMWPAVTIALPSRDDELKLRPGETREQLFERLSGLGVEEIALKDGDNGPSCWLQGERVECGGFEPASRVVDTTGAGDGFNGGYLAARIRGASVAEAARAGHDMAARIVGVAGAILPRA